MKKLILKNKLILLVLIVGVSLFSTYGVFASGMINLSVGQTINIDGNTISCGGTSINPGVVCNRLKTMSSKAAYDEGFLQGFGSCNIFVNAGYYGVMLNGQQVSPTYTDGFDTNTSFNSDSMTASTGFVELVCSGRCR